VNNKPITATTQLNEATIGASVLFATVVRGHIKVGEKIEFD
jgi:hypothetical protein